MSENIEMALVPGLIAELADNLGISAINTLPGAWVYDMNAIWRIAANGHDYDIDIPSDGNFMGATLKPYHFGVWYNGWLAGLFNPFDGIILAGTFANEDMLISVLRDAITIAKRDDPPVRP